MIHRAERGILQINLLLICCSSRVCMKEGGTTPPTSTYELQDVVRTVDLLYSTVPYVQYYCQAAGGRAGARTRTLVPTDLCGAQESARAA